jgi:hypothetical protein
MAKSLKGLMVVNACLLVWNLFSVTGHAQRPPQASADGVAYLPVNINPTEVPPLVNINPDGVVPKVEVDRMPDIKFPASGCSDQRNFQTAVGRSITGPLLVTFLNLPQQTPVTLGSAQGGTQRVTLASSTSLATGIYLRAGQQMTFDVDVLYSGCRPE